MRSDRVSLKGKEKSTAGKEAVALVEAGPRSLRPAGLPGLAMLDLVSGLNDAAPEYHLADHCYI